MIADINARATRGEEPRQAAEAAGRQCFNCDAKKACCHSMVVARLYEGIVVAAHLKQANRDTPELRDELRATPSDGSGRARTAGACRACSSMTTERCTVYAARPSPCGALFVYTPPQNCSDPSAPVKAYVAHDENAIAQQIEDQFRDELSLRKKVGRRYIGVLPRMVLVALEAWDRTDFRDYLRQLEWPTDADADRWRQRAP